MCLRYVIWLNVCADAIPTQVLYIIDCTIVHIAVNHGLGQHRAAIDNTHFAKYSKVSKNRDDMLFK